MNAVIEIAQYIYYYKFLYSFNCFFCPSILYLLVLCFAGIFITLTLSKLFSIRWLDAAKAFFCSTLIVFGFLGIWGFLILNALGGTYISLIIDELHCILLIIASIIFARSKSSKLSWLWGILLLLFAWPIIKLMAQLFTLHANIMKLTPTAFSWLSIIILGYALTMMFLLWGYLRKGSLKRIQFLLLTFVLLLATHECAEFLIAKSEKWFEFHRPRVVYSGFKVEPKKMVEEITKK